MNTAVGLPVEARVWEEGDHPRGSGAQGGQFVPKGSGNSGRTATRTPARRPARRRPQPRRHRPTAPASGRGPAEKLAPAKPQPGRRLPSLRAGARNDPARVKHLQALIAELGLAKLGIDGSYGTATEDAVKEVQRRLGLKPTGRATSGLIRRLGDAHKLSPCVNRATSRVAAAAADILEPVDADADDGWDDDVEHVATLPGDAFDLLLWSDGTAWLTDDGVSAVEELAVHQAWRVLAEFNESLHPRNPAGHQGGGRFRSKLGAIADALTALAGLADETDRTDGLYFGEDADGTYFDWSTRIRHGGYQFEFGNDEEAVQVNLSRDDLQRLFTAMAITRMQASEPSNPDVAALTTIGYHGGVSFEESGADFDWSSVEDDGTRVFEANDASDEFSFALTPQEFDQLYARIGLTLLADQQQGETVTAAAGRDVTPGHEQLHHYWTRDPEGLAKWADSPTPWTTLVAHLTPHVGPERAKRFASKWFQEVFGFAAGSDLNRVTHGKPPRGHLVGPG